jgi:hypothetical protein
MALQETLEQAEYVIEELSKSTNEKHAQERRETLTALRVAREVAEFGPCELLELQEGESRLRFTWPELMAFMKTPEYLRLLDTNDLVTMLGDDGLGYALDIVARQSTTAAAGGVA